MNNAKIAIITVCLNAQNTIRRTIESVLSQSYRPLEYIIIDGKSSDETYQIILSYREHFKNAGIEIISSSEKDKGIYNAMNKGIRMSHGEWVLFLNADDYLYDMNSLSNLYGFLSDDSVDVIYGDEYVFGEKNTGYINKRGFNIDSISKSLPFCHQSSLTRRYLLEEHPFNEKYKIVSDYEFFLYCYLKKRSFVYSNMIIAAYYQNGESRKQFLKAIDESYEVKNSYGIVDIRKLSTRLKKYIWKLYLLIKLKR